MVKFDLRPGGGFQTLMREGTGTSQPHVDACFLDIIPNQQLVWTTLLTEGWQPTKPWLALTAIISFTEKDGGTDYHCRVLHQSAEDAQKHEDLGFHPGWGATIDQLSTYCQQLL